MYPPPSSWISSLSFSLISHAMTQILWFRDLAVVSVVCVSLSTQASNAVNTLANLWSWCRLLALHAAVSKTAPTVRWLAKCPATSVDDSEFKELPQRQIQMIMWLMSRYSKWVQDSGYCNSRERMSHILPPINMLFFYFEQCLSFHSWSVYLDCNIRDPKK